MKKINRIWILFLASGLFFSCSQEDNVQPENEDIKVESFTAELGDRNMESPTNTRAITDFAVNKTNQDPTRDITRLTGIGNWTLDIKVFDINGLPYTPGNATCQYNSGYWVPATDMYLPHYRTPKVEVILYPSTWNPTSSVPDLDQGDANKLLAQDILVENGAPYTIIPSHTPTIQLRHKHSMLDFILSNVDINDIADVKVAVGNNIYTPYKVTGNNNQEYLAILPVGTSNPQVRITTNAGAKYTQTISINNSAINNCYCVKLIGLELLLSSVTVIDWTYGTALEGQYTTVASYPTFRGQANATVTLHFINGLSQDITFNERGESTVKPLGRTITQINDLVLTTPIILNEMYVDLSNIPGLWN